MRETGAPGVRIDQLSLGHAEVPTFTEAEFAARIEGARALMTEHELDGIMVTCRAQSRISFRVRHAIRLGESDAALVFVLPREGEASAIIPEIGLTNWLETSWCRTVGTWPSPTPENEGLDILGATIARVRRRFGRRCAPRLREGAPTEGARRALSVSAQ